MLSFEVTLKFDNAGRFHDFAALMDKHGFIGDADASAVSTAGDEPVKTAINLPKPVAANKPAAKKAAPTKEQAAPQSQPEPEDDLSGQPAVTFNDVANATLKLVKEKGRDKAVAILTAFNVAKAPELTEDQYADYLARVGEALAA